MNELYKNIVIPVGGKGERLYPMTKSLPKSLVHIGNAPLLYRLLNQIIAAGFQNIYLLSGFLHEQIYSYVYDIFIPTMPKDVNINIINTGQTGTVKGIMLAEQMLDSPFVYSDGNLFLETNPFSSLIQSKVNKEDEVKILCSEKQRAETHLQLWINSQKNIYKMGQGLNGEKGPLCSMGIFMFNSSFLNYLNQNGEKFTDIDYLIEDFYMSNYKVNHLIYKNEWVGIHEKQDITLAKDIYKNIKKEKKHET